MEWVLLTICPLITSPITFVLHLKEEDIPEFNSIVLNASYPFTIPAKEIADLPPYPYCQSRITLLVYLSPVGSFYHDNYPINTLRNFGIHHTRTSHYVYLDVDMWPSCRYGS